MWDVRFMPDAQEERAELPASERNALDNAVLKLENIGPALGYPHTSSVRQAPSLRELRPRQGRSPWRALYRQVGNVFVVAAVCPEAESDPRGFSKACTAAVARLDELEE